MDDNHAKSGTVGGEFFYHVNRIIPYGPQRLLEVGDTISTSSENNPFMDGFKIPRAYPYTHPDGRVEVFHGSRLLKAASLGEVQGDILHRIGYEVTEYFYLMARETLMELVRREVRRNAPSRWSCLWICRTLDEARKWSEKLDAHNKCIVKISCYGMIAEVDTKFLPDNESLFLDMRQMAERYWLGEISAEPDMEVLFAGVAKVVEVIKDLA